MRNLNQLNVMRWADSVRFCGVLIISYCTMHVQCWCTLVLLIRIRSSWSFVGSREFLLVFGKENDSMDNFHWMQLFNYESHSAICQSSLSSRRSITDSLPISHSPIVEALADPFSTLWSTGCGTYGFRLCMYFESWSNSCLEIADDQWSRDGGFLKV